MERCIGVGAEDWSSGVACDRQQESWEFDPQINDEDVVAPLRLASFVRPAVLQTKDAKLAKLAIHVGSSLASALGAPRPPFAT